MKNSFITFTLLFLSKNGQKIGSARPKKLRGYNGWKRGYNSSTCMLETKQQYPTYKFLTKYFPKVNQSFLQAPFFLAKGMIPI